MEGVLDCWNKLAQQDVIILILLNIFTCILFAAYLSNFIL